MWCEMKERKEMEMEMKPYGNENNLGRDGKISSRRISQVDH